VPLHDGRVLAERNGVLEKLLPIFDYIPGDRSPPPAPKHATAASNRPKVPRQSAAARRNGKKSEHHFSLTPSSKIPLDLSINIIQIIGPFQYSNLGPFQLRFELHASTMDQGH
jgi:hypothetical protein